MMKTKQDNDVTNLIGVIYFRSDIELSCLIKPSVNRDENQIGQRRDWSYKCGIHQK